FTMTLPQGFRFRSGEFSMIGLMVEVKPVFRAYSIASPAWAEELEFFSIKVPDGPLTSHLQAIKPVGIVRDIENRLGIDAGGDGQGEVFGL
ncbi:hypothetical protein ACC754_38960, partial [Rhizobium johnstonii]